MNMPYPVPYAAWKYLPYTGVRILPTLLDRCLKLYTTLWNIWTYQQLCKKITQLVYNFTQIVYNFTQVVYFIFYTTVGRFICFTLLCKLFKQWSNSVY